jgi:hypothetical protein
MRTICTVLLVVSASVALLLLTPTRPARSDDAPAAVSPLLKVCQDEATLEKQIEAWLRTVKEVPGVKLSYADKEEQDAGVLIPVDCEGVPHLRVVIDTAASGRDDAGKVTERMISVDSYYVLPDAAKTPEARAKLLELNNTWMRDNGSPDKVYIDKDGDVYFATTINIPGPDVSVSAELVFDAIARTRPFWEAYYPLLKKELNLPDEEAGGEE